MGSSVGKRYFAKFVLLAVYLISKVPAVAALVPGGESITEVVGNFALGILLIVLIFRLEGATSEGMTVGDDLQSTISQAGDAHAGLIDVKAELIQLRKTIAEKDSVVHAQLALAQDNYRDAEHLSRNVLSVQPNNKAAQFILGQSLAGRARRGEKAPQEALEILDRVLKNDPHNSDVLLVAADLCMWARPVQSHRAAELYERAWEVKKESVIQFRLAKALVRTNRRRAEGIELLKQISNNRPNDFNVALELANAFYSGGLSEEAIGLARNFVAANPKAVRVRLGLANYLMNAPDGDSAIENEMEDNLAWVESYGPLHLHDSALVVRARWVLKRSVRAPIDQDEVASLREGLERSLARRSTIKIMAMAVRIDILGGRLDQALGLARKLCAQAPGYSQNWIVYCVILGSLGKWNELQKATVSLLRIESLPSRIFGAVFRLLARLGGGDDPQDLGKEAEALWRGLSDVPDFENREETWTAVSSSWASQLASLDGESKDLAFKLVGFLDGDGESQALAGSLTRLIPTDRWTHRRT